MNIITIFNDFIMVRDLIEEMESITEDFIITEHYSIYLDAQKIALMNKQIDVLLKR